MICFDCGSECSSKLGPDNPVEFECPLCGGKGEEFGKPCEHCNGGFFQVNECCARNLAELAPAINLASRCKNGFLPVAGGILDQSNWFLELWTALDVEQGHIDQERMSKL